MDQVERALLVASGDAASGKLVADSHVRHCCCTICFSSASNHLVFGCLD